MTKTFDSICNKILGETIMTAPTTPATQPAPIAGQPAKPPVTPGQPATPPNPADQARLKKITDALTQIKDPAHFDAVEKLLAGLTAQKPTPNAANQQA